MRFIPFRPFLQTKRLTAVRRLILGMSLLAVFLWLGLAILPVHAAGFTVNSTGDGSDANPGNGICATSGGVCTLRAAIQEANALAGADTITLPAGTYSLTIGGVSEDNAATGDLDITTDITILGAGAGSTTINGSSLSDRIFQIMTAGSLTLNDLTVSGSSVTNYTGGAVSNAGTLIATDVVFSGNTITNSVGGAIYSTGTTTLTRVAIFGNAATNGGGIDVAGGTTTLTNVTVSGNSSTLTAATAGGYGWVGVQPTSPTQSLPITTADGTAKMSTE
jgi:CSLREA domain-containing protein